MQITDTILQKLNLYIKTYELVRSKAGISVFRLETAGEKLILKIFENLEERREIENYQLLRELGIVTLPVKVYLEEAILLPDVNESDKYRLGEEADLNDVQVAKAIAKWYRQLHDKGKGYLDNHSVSMYDELDMITPENMRRVAEETDSRENTLWKMIESRYDAMKKKIVSLPRTLTYNDFYWDNLIVAKDGTEAFMFDYNLLGKGIAYGDVRNVTSSMSEAAAKAFCEAYDTSGLENEKLADDILAHLVTLCVACERKSFPAWAEESKKLLLSGELQQNFMKWIGKQ